MRLDDCLSRAARIWPDRIASVDGGKSRTWQQVSDDVQGLAAVLSSVGVHAGNRVAILGANSGRYLDCFFAASWLGALVVPLNIRLARAELAACLVDSGPRVLLAGDGYSDAALELAREVRGLRVVHAGDGPAPVGLLPLAEAGQTKLADRPSGGGEIPAGIFYTGGTTGVPKGVVLTHDNLLANAWHVLPQLGWDDRTVFLHAAPMFHLADICCLVAVSVVGGQHVILPRFETEEVISAVAAHGVTALGLVPAMINALTARLGGRQLPSLTSMLYGGSPMPEELIIRTRELLPQVRLWQAYGQTEASPILTLLAPEHHLPGAAGRAKSAGQPVPGCQITIRDPASGTDLPHGQAGEICGRGDNVMSGYWKQPDLTASVLADGWLRTGDAGYLDADGFLYVTGRLDDMIITGGENVYPTEVEDVLYRYPTVAEAAVIGLPDPTWGQRVHAIVVLWPGSGASGEELALFCRQFLGSYKCPRSFEFRDALPKTGVGKVNRKLLVTESMLHG